MNPTDPRLIRSVRELQEWADQVRARGRTIALVPTLGSIHEGHLSLVRLARERAERVVVSIFVNPTQFGPSEDFDRYPRDLEGDLRKLRPLHVDVVFAPSVEQLYPPGDATRVEVRGLTEGLCGRTRPELFPGVTTVVARLLNAAKPHVAVFGEKDYQQLLVVRRMVRDLAFDVQVVAGPTVREPDGLALSSRNEYLGAEERIQARVLNAALYEVRDLHRAGERDAARLVDAARRRLAKDPRVEVEYVELCDAETLEPLERVDRRAVVALAARVGGARLIDNAVLEVE